MLEAQKFLTNMLTEIGSKSYGIFVNLRMSLRQLYFQMVLGMKYENYAS